MQTPSLIGCSSSAAQVGALAARGFVPAGWPGPYLRLPSSSCHLSYFVCLVCVCVRWSKSMCREALSSQCVVSGTLVKASCPFCHSFEHPGRVCPRQSRMLRWRVCRAAPQSESALQLASSRCQDKLASFKKVFAEWQKKQDRVPFMCARHEGGGTFWRRA